MLEAGEVLRLCNLTRQRKNDHVSTLPLNYRPLPQRYLSTWRLLVQFRPPVPQTLNHPGLVGRCAPRTWHRCVAAPVWLSSRWWRSYDPGTSRLLTSGASREHFSFVLLHTTDKTVTVSEVFLTWNMLHRIDATFVYVYIYFPTLTRPHRSQTDIFHLFVFVDVKRYLIWQTTTPSLKAVS